MQFVGMAMSLTGHCCSREAGEAADLLDLPGLHGVPVDGAAPGLTHFLPLLCSAFDHFLHREVHVSPPLSFIFTAKKLQGRNHKINKSTNISDLNHGEDNFAGLVLLALSWSVLDSDRLYRVQAEFLFFGITHLYHIKRCEESVIQVSE